MHLIANVIREWLTDKGYEVGTHTPREQDSARLTVDGRVVLDFTLDRVFADAQDWRVSCHTNPSVWAIWVAGTRRLDGGPPSKPDCALMASFSDPLLFDLIESHIERELAAPDQRTK